MLDIVRLVLQQMGSSLEPDILGEASHEIPHQYLSARKARELLDWKPLFTLEEGLRRTITWYMNYLQQPLASSSTT